MKKYYIIVILLFIVQFDIGSCDNTGNDFPFQKKIWTFWNSSLDSAQTYVRICHQKFIKQCKQAGFEYVNLNFENLKDYIPDYHQKVEPLRKIMTLSKSIAHYIDLIRFIVVYEHGGMWFDLTSMNFENFDWLLNIKSQKYKKYITNRFSEDPEVLLPYYGEYQNVAEHKIVSPNNKGQRIRYNEYPGYQEWFFAAKKNSLLLKAVVDAYTELMQLKQTQMKVKFTEQDTYMNFQQTGLYLTADRAISYVFQKKQMQFDRQNLTLFGTRYNAHQYFKTWLFKAQLGPLFWVNSFQLDRADYPFTQLESLKQNKFQLNFFIKGTLEARLRIEGAIQNATKIFQKMSFQEYLASKPSQQNCRQMKFFAQGMIGSKLIQNSEVLAKTSFRIISREQQRKWIQYCNQYKKQESLLTRIKNAIHRHLFPRVTGNEGDYNWYGVRQYYYDQKYENKVMTLSQWAQKQFDIHFWTFYLWERIWIIGYFAILGITAAILIIYNLYRCYLKGRCEIQQKSKNNLLNQSSDYNRVKQKAHQTLKIIFSPFLLLLFSLYSLILIDRIMTMTFGFHDEMELNLLVIIVSIFWYHKLKSYLKASITRHNSNAITLPSQSSPQSQKYFILNIVFRFLSFFILYLIVEMILFFYTYDYFALNYQSLVIGIGGLCLYKCSKVLVSKHGSQNIVLRKYVHLALILIIPVIFILVPNSRYIVVKDRYFASHIPWIIIFYYLPIVYGAILYQYLKIRNWMQLVRVGLLLFIGVMQYHSMYQMGCIFQFMAMVHNATMYGFLNVIYNQIEKPYSSKRQSQHVLFAFAFVVNSFIVIFSFHDYVKPPYLVPRFVMTLVVQIICLVAALTYGKMGKLVQNKNRLKNNGYLRQSQFIQLPSQPTSEVKNTETDNL